MLMTSLCYPDHVVVCSKCWTFVQNLVINGTFVSMLKKSQTLTLGGSNPVNCHLFLRNKPTEWTSKIKYLGIHILAGDVQEVDFTDAKIVLWML